MSIPKETRQIMINLMYLVLTALLALNVSNEILHAFKVMNESINKSNTSIQEKNKVLYDQITDNEKAPGQYDKVHPYKLKADEAKAAADSMFNYLQGWKERIMMQSGGKTEDGLPKAEDNIDASTLLLVEKGGGDTIKNKLQILRDRFLGMLSPTDRASIEKQLPLKIEAPKKSENNPTADWKVEYFHNMPTMAAIALFAKFQNDVRNSEAQVVNVLFNEAHQTELKFDELQAVATPKTTYALEGQKIEGTILMAAYNKNLNPTVSASEGHVTKVENGVAYWETTATGTGQKKVTGSVTLNTPSGPKTQPFNFEYTVGSTGASMQLDKMNVFYIGVPNPVTLSAAGYSLEDVSLSIPGANITNDAKGHYIITVDKQGTVDAAINAKEQGGGIKRVGGMQVRVKYIPDPVATVGGISSGGMQSNVFRSQLGVIAELKGFDFDARFTVTSFTFAVVPKHGEYIGPYTVNGNRFDLSKDVQKAIERVKPGDKVFIEEVKAVGPDHRGRQLNPVILSLR
jgi:gliding motility-associated protein GldM